MGRHKRLTILSYVGTDRRAGLRRPGMACTAKSFPVAPALSHDLPPGHGARYNVSCLWVSIPLLGSTPSPRHHMCFSVCRLALIRGILENVPNSLTGPDSLTGGGRCTGLLKATANFCKTAAVSSDPGEDLLHYLCMLGNWLKPRLTAAFTDRHIAITERRAGHHVKRPTLSSMLLSSPAPLHHLGPLIFGDDALHLQQQIIFWAFAEWPI